MKLLQSFLKYLRNVNLLFKKNFNSAELLTKVSNFFYFRDRPKNGEWKNKGDVKSIRVKVTINTTKKVAKAAVDLNELWTFYYVLFWLYIYIHEQFSLFDTSANVLTDFMISLFLAAPTCSKSTKEHET